MLDSMLKLFLTFLLFFQIVPAVFAQDIEIPVEKYSYKNSEQLKPLIHWHDYSKDVFTLAKQEQKPVFMLLTAPSWCYACQLYESRKSLYDPAVIKEINEQFIPVYVDTDKRQDITRQYLQGGWPTTVVLNSDGKLLNSFLGQRSPKSLLAILSSVRNTTLKPQPLSYKKTPLVSPSDTQLQKIIANHITFLEQNWDPTYGGLGSINRKYPQGRTLDFALDKYEKTQNKAWFTIVLTTLWNQYTLPDQVSTNYHLYDPIEGGFHRYSNQRNWTFPHFEKMLYDNARLLKAYAHFLKLSPKDPVANDVVQKTTSYIVSNWYDSTNGGFYGNTDSGEDGAYYKREKRTGTLRIEKTKYTDWNSEAILTFVYLWKTTKNPQYKQIAQKSLDFLQSSVVTDEGVYHFVSTDGTKHIIGNVTDNAYALLAFIEGYGVLRDPQYLKTAQKLADSTIHNFYDWQSGGFFERHSPDTSLYPPGEEIILIKPFEEQGILAYSLSRLYTNTKKISYLNVALKTMGSILPSYNDLTQTYTKADSTGGHLESDTGYYGVQTAQYALQNNLTEQLALHKKEITELEKQELQSFWLTGYLKSHNIAQKDKITQDGFNTTQPFYLLLLVAFLAGFLSMLSPCCFPIFPTFLAYSMKSSKHNIVGMTICFFVGLSITFVLLGMSATYVGSFLKTHIVLFSQITGAALMVFGIFSLSGKGLPGIHLQTKKSVSYMGALILGGAFGISWTPCVGPILVGILIIASTTNSIFSGGLLLFVYTIGLSIPLILLTFFLKNRNEHGPLWKILRGKELKIRFGTKAFEIHTSSLLSGILFLILGYLMFSGTLYALNKFVVNNFFQQLLFSIENRLINI